MLLNYEMLDNGNPLFALSVLLILGFILGEIASRMKLPSLVGQIAAGILVGPYGLDLFTPQMFKNFAPITDFALCIFGLTMGTHLILRQLHNAGKRMIYILIAQILIVPPVIFVTLYYGLNDIPLPACLLLAAIGLETSPGSIIHIVVRRRSKGIFTKTLITSVALNSIATLVLFSIAYQVALAAAAPDPQAALKWGPLLWEAVREIVIALFIGAVAGVGTLLLTRKNTSLTYHFSLLIVTLLLIAGICKSLQLPGFLSSMMLGFMVGNYASNKQILLKSFDNIEPGIYALFFVLAGTHIDFHMVKAAGVAGTAYVLARSAGKFIAPALGAVLANAAQSIRRWIGLTFFPHAGIAIGLLVIVDSQPLFADFAEYITAIVLGAVVIYEILGPILTDMGIQKSDEVDKQKARLLDFLQEEYILVGLEETDKWKVIEELAEFMHKVHAIKEISVKDLIKSIVEREKSMSTGIGDGLAVPHAIIEGGPEIRGVVGISHKGIEFDSIDGKSVYLLVLIATPRTHYDHHLRVLAGIAKIFGQDPEIKSHILKAKNAAEVHEIFQTGRADAVNVYLDTTPE